VAAAAVWKAMSRKYLGTPVPGGLPDLVQVSGVCNSGEMRHSVCHCHLSLGTKEPAFSPFPLVPNLTDGVSLRRPDWRPPLLLPRAGITGVRHPPDRTRTVPRRVVARQGWSGARGRGGPSCGGVHSRLEALSSGVPRGFKVKRTGRWAQQLE
jgi:hypothetical protein